MTMDLEAPHNPCLISTLLGGYEIPKVSIPPLDLPTLSFPLGLLEEISGMSDPLIDLAHIILLMSTPGLTPPISFQPYLRTLAGSLIALPLTLLLIHPTATMKLPVPTIAPLVSPF